MKNRLAVAVGVAAICGLTAPTVVQAGPPDHWIKCPACESTGNGTYGEIYHTFTIATAGTYDIWGEATSAGIFDFYFYGPDYTPADNPPCVFTPPWTATSTCAAGTGPDPNWNVTFNFDAGVNPHGKVGSVNFVAGTYYSGVTGACTQGGQGCNVNIEILPAGEVPVSPVPEPASMVLLGSGLLALAGAAQRRRKQQS